VGDWKLYRHKATRPDRSGIPAAIYWVGPAGDWEEWESVGRLRPEVVDRAVEIRNPLNVQGGGADTPMILPPSMSNPAGTFPAAAIRADYEPITVEEATRLLTEGRAA